MDKEKELGPESSQPENTLPKSVKGPISYHVKEIDMIEQ